MGALVQASGLIALLAGVAVAQPAPRAPSRGLVQAIPALYWARLSSTIVKRMPPFPNGLSAQVRVYMTTDGAVTEVVFLRHSGVDVFDRMLERELAAFAVTAEERLPVATDPKMRAAAVQEGVTLVIRSRFKDKAPGKSLKGGRRINLPSGVKLPGIRRPGIKRPGDSRPGSGANINRQPGQPLEAGQPTPINTP